MAEMYTKLQIFWNIYPQGHARSRYHPGTNKYWNATMTRLQQKFTGVLLVVYLLGLSSCFCIGKCFKWTNCFYVKIFLLVCSVFIIQKFITSWTSMFSRWCEKYLSKRSPLKHTCSWRVNLLYYNYF